MVAATQTKFVIVTPGRVAFTTAAAKERFTSRPKQVIWTPYLEELLTLHGDIQVVDSPAKLLAAQEAAKVAAVKQPQPQNQSQPTPALKPRPVRAEPAAQ